MNEAVTASGADAKAKIDETISGAQSLEGLITGVIMILVTALIKGLFAKKA